MSTDTRQTILDAAKRLFTERGYNAVSMNDIAQAVGISKGNLTYHFQKKEALIEALIDQNTFAGNLAIPTTIAQVQDYFSHLESVIENNAFYFWHYAQLAQISSRIQEKQSTMFAYNRSFLKETFKSLEEHQLMMHVDALGADMLINALLLTVVYWLPFENLSESLSITLQQQLWSLLLPYLTQQGKAAYKTLTI